MKTISAIVLIFDGPQNIHAAIVNEPYMRLVIEDIGIDTWGQNLADQGFLEAARRAVVNRADRPGE